MLRASCPNIHTVLWRQNLIRAGDVTVCYKLYVDCSWNLFNFRNDGEIEVIQQKMNEYLLVNLDSLSKQGSVAKRFLISVKKRPCYNTVGLASKKCSSLHTRCQILAVWMAAVVGTKHNFPSRNLHA